MVRQPMQPCFQTPHNDCEAKSLEQGWTGTALSICQFYSMLAEVHKLESRKQ